MIVLPYGIAASYARTATPDPDQIAHQHEANARLARQDGYAIPAAAEYRFSDDGFSGRNAERAGWSRLVEVITSRRMRFERLYVTDPTCLGRWFDGQRRYDFEVHFLLCDVEVVYEERPGVVYRSRARDGR